MFLTGVLSPGSWTAFGATLTCAAPTLDDLCLFVTQLAEDGNAVWARVYVPTGSHSGFVGPSGIAVTPDGQVTLSGGEPALLCGPISRRIARS
jgi:hypothetical protein